MVVDYAERMQDSIQKLQEVMSHSTHYLLTSSKSYYKPSLQKSSFDLDDFRETYDSLPKQSNINIESPDEPSRYGGTHSLCVYIFCLSCLFTLFFLVYRVVLFNSHARRRTEVVTVKVSIPNVRVYKIHNIEGDDEGG